MFPSTYFVQECPTCGRSAEIRVEYLGKQLVCQHCHGSFVAADPETSHQEIASTRSAIMRRAEELLALAEQRHATISSAVVNQS